jgi:hypothetical protein
MRSSSQLSVESGDGSKILKQKKRSTNTTTTINQQRRNVTDDSDFLFWSVAIGVGSFSLLFALVGFSGTKWFGLGTKWTHIILAYTAPFLILFSVLGVCLPISLLLLGENHISMYGGSSGRSGGSGSMSTFERRQIAASLNQKFGNNTTNGAKRRRRSESNSDNNNSDISDSSSSSSSSDSNTDSDSDSPVEDLKME